jgi:hypothetical protein
VEVDHLGGRRRASGGAERVAARVPHLLRRGAVASDRECVGTCLFLFSSLSS